MGCCTYEGKEIMSDNKPAGLKENPDAELKKSEPQELKDLRSFLQTHGVPIAIGVCFVVAVCLALAYRYNKNEEAKLETSKKLFTAKTPQDLSMIVEQQSSTPAAPFALLKLAKASFDSGNYDMAMNKYNDFKTKYPKHEFIEAAELGSIHCIEARGQFEEAATAFAGFITKNPKHFLTPEAIFGQARCLEQLGRYKEARALYEDFIAAHPESGWIPRAKELLDAASKNAKEETKPAKAVMSTNYPVGNLEMPVPR
jgi:TolA-binding protein